MFDHLGIAVGELAASKRFFLAALAPLGVRTVMEYAGAVGLGQGDKPSLWLAAGPVPGARLHIAFTARSRGEVDAFHRAAIAAGGIDNGPPGIRAHYHPNYYGAFVLDPDGNNVEAVCHAPEA